jgi:hypothetical protein
VWKARTSRRRHLHRLRVVVRGGLVEIDGLAFRRR